MAPFFLALITAGIWGIVPILEKTGLQTSHPLAGLFYRCIGVMLGFVILLIFFLKPTEIKAVDNVSYFRTEEILNVLKSRGIE